MALLAVLQNASVLDTTEADEATTTSADLYFAAGTGDSRSSTDGFGEVNVSLSSLFSLGDELTSVNDTGSVNSTTHVYSTVASEDNGCEEWQAAQHTLFQMANLCYAAAFFVPHNFKLSVLLMRSILCCGYLLFTVWAGVYICAPDIFAWNLTFVAINMMHVLYLTCKHFPPRVPNELRDLYTKVFIPLKVDKKHFKDLTREAKMLSLEEGAHYAVEEVTSADERLSLLFEGRLKVSCDGTHLHYILPNQFIDSPEWEACPMDSDHLFQVTITAVEPCRYLCWPRRRLQHVLKSRPFLDAIIYNLIGKDITQKLYSLNEHLNPRRNKAQRTTSDWYLRHQVPRSVSADAVHLSAKGNVRSQVWHGHRRSSTSCSDSIGYYSPASRYSHLSDPGPYQSPYRQMMTPGPVRRVPRPPVHQSPPLAARDPHTLCSSPPPAQVPSPSPLHVAFETPV